MSKKTFTCTEKIFKYPGLAAWYFVPITKEVSTQIKTCAQESKLPKRGWGSIRVRATIEKTSWDTSIFPDSRSGRFMLPVKKEVRLKEDVWDGDMVKVRLVLLPLV